MQYVLDQAVEGLGYRMVESTSDIYNFAQFGNEDQTINRFVKKISDKPLTWSQANEEASNNNLNYDTSNFLDADGWTGSNLSWTLDRNKHYYDSKAIHLKQIKMQVVKDSNTAHQLFQQGNLDDA